MKLEELIPRSREGKPNLLRIHGGTEKIHKKEGATLLEPKFTADRSGCARECVALSCHG